MATIIDIRAPGTELSPAKRPPTLKDGLATSHHLVLTVPAAVLRAGGARFAEKSATERTPAHYHAFTGGVNVHLRDGLRPEQVQAGTPVRVELCATIVRKGDEAVDGNVYLNVFPSQGDEPEATVSVHNLGSLPKDAERVYHGRSSGAVALRPPPERVVPATDEEIVAVAQERVDEAQQRLDAIREAVAERRGGSSIMDRRPAPRSGDDRGRG